jgi:mono/diheme cytochrome c family protein
MRKVVVLLLSFSAIASAETTYTRDVARIMQAKCQQCHRPGDVAPFPLMTYDDAVTYADDIKTALNNKTMPPWKPVPGFNEFRDSFAISDDERNTVLAWIDGGTPQGDAADMPDPQPVSDGPWQLGEPDVILKMPEYTPPPRATDTYRCFVLPTGLTENRFIAAAQALPGNPQITHHVLLFLDETGEAEKFEGQDGQPGYSCFGGPNLTSILTAPSLLTVLSGGIDILNGTLLGGWAPGVRTRRLPDDIGVPISKGARIVMQVHYHPAGREGSDQTQLGVWFADTAKIKHRLLNVPIFNTKFTIPPGASNYEVTASQFVFPFLAGKVITVAPHMHNLGRQIKVEVEDPGGKKRPLIYIDNWDFNWQGFYVSTDPIDIPSGSTVRVTAVYDNSEGNPKNPNNPIVPVGWGERTVDEMCLAFVGVIFNNESLLPLPFSASGR